MKKKIIVLLSVLAAFAIIAAGTYAYFTANDSATNTFTMGNVKIDLTETAWDNQNNTAMNNVVPGREISKNPNVKNIGNNDAYIRVNVTVSDAAAWMAVVPAGTDLTTIFKGFNDSNWTLAKAPVLNNTDNKLTYTYNFNTVVAPRGDTGELFTSVIIPTSMTTTQASAFGTDFTITITADAIQAEGFSNVTDAFIAYDAQ